MRCDAKEISTERHVGRKSCQEKQAKTSVPNVPRQGDAKVKSRGESYFHRDFKKGDVKRRGCQEDETLRFRAAKGNVNLILKRKMAQEKETLREGDVKRKRCQRKNGPGESGVQRKGHQKALLTEKDVKRTRFKAKKMTWKNNCGNQLVTLHSYRHFLNRLILETSASCLAWALLTVLAFSSLSLPASSQLPLITSMISVPMCK